MDIKMALTAGTRQTPTITIRSSTVATVATESGVVRRIKLKRFDKVLLARRLTSAVATLVIRRREVDYRALAVDAITFTVTVPADAAVVGSDYAPNDAFMILDIIEDKVS